MPYKRLIWIVSTMFLLAFGLMFSALRTTEQVTEAVKPPPRPANVPVDAHWCYRPACEVWVLGEQLEDDSSLYYCRVWDHPGGVLQMEAVCRLEGEPMVWDKLRWEIAVFDGYELYLRGERGFYRTGEQFSRIN